jgi:hypothetical protein
VVVDHNHVYIRNGLCQVHAGVYASERGFSKNLSRSDILLKKGFRRRIR